MTLTADIQAAIDAYEPLARPPADALTGWVIAIRPGGGGSADPAVRRADDVALHTAAVLFHCVQWAGGTPVLTRADDAPERPELLAEVAPDLVLALTGTRAAGRNLAASNGFHVATDVAGNSAALTRAVAEELGADGGDGGGEPLGDIPQVEVVLGVARTAAGDESPPTLPGELATRLCAALVKFARGRRAPAARPVPVGPAPRFVDRTPEAELTAAARRIWPEGALPRERAQWFCDLWTSAVLSDRSFVHFCPRIVPEHGGLRLEGATNTVQLRDTLVSALAVVGLGEVGNAMRLLPEEGRVDGERCGVCTAPTALTYAEPSERSGLRSQLLYGELLHLLDRADDFVLVHGADGYWGWVRASAVKPITEEEFAAAAQSKRAVLVEDVELDGVRAPRGAVLPFEFSVSGHVTLTGPDGARFEASAHHVRAFDVRSEAAERIARALALLHRPYVYGGVSPLGLDCSGLAQTLARQTGVQLPRDAAQQFGSGRLVATRWQRAGIEPGDLLYFINTCGRIFHVGMALNATHFIHSGPPGVKIDSLAPGDRLYAPARDATFLAARRL